MAEGGEAAVIMAERLLEVSISAGCRLGAPRNSLACFAAKMNGTPALPGVV